MAARNTFKHRVEPGLRLDSVFHALADPTRRSMLRSLARGEASIGDLAAPYRMSLAAVSKHVKGLERAGLLQRTVHGRTHLCRIDTAPLSLAEQWLRMNEGFWNTRLDALGEALREEEVPSQLVVKKIRKSPRRKESPR